MEEEREARLESLFEADLEVNSHLLRPQVVHICCVQSHHSLRKPCMAHSLNLQLLRVMVISQSLQTLNLQWLNLLLHHDVQEADMRQDTKPGQPEAVPDEGSGAPAARRTLASVGATDAISDALEAAEAEEKRTADHAASGTGKSSTCWTTAAHCGSVVAHALQRRQPPSSAMLRGC